MAQATYRQLYEQNINLIQEVNQHLCRRRQLSRDECDEFSSLIQLKMMQDDFGVFRKFKGQSSLRTYLVTVVHHLFQDWRNQQWGKWRPSAAAERLGDVAILLERLTTRDSFRFEEAIELMRTNYRVDLSPAELRTLITRLPIREPRRFTTDEALACLATNDPDPQDQLITGQDVEIRQKAERVMLAAMDDLADMDRLILKLRYYQDLKVTEIATRLKQNSKKLYKDFDRIYATLKKSLASEGFDDDLIKEILP